MPPMGWQPLPTTAITFYILQRGRTLYVCMYVCANSMCPDEIEIMMAHCFCWFFIVFFCSLLFLVNWFFFWYSFDFFPSHVFFLSSLNFCFYFSYQVNKTNQMFVVFVSGSNYIHTSVYTHPHPLYRWQRNEYDAFVHSFIHLSMLAIIIFSVISNHRRTDRRTNGAKRLTAQTNRRSKWHQRTNNNYIKLT